MKYYLRNCCVSENSMISIRKRYYERMSPWKERTCRFLIINTILSVKMSVTKDLRIKGNLKLLFTVRSVETASLTLPKVCFFSGAYQSSEMLLTSVRLKTT